MNAEEVHDVIARCPVPMDEISIILDVLAALNYRLAIVESKIKKEST